MPGDGLGTGPGYRDLRRGSSEGVDPRRPGGHGSFRSQHEASRPSFPAQVFIVLSSVLPQRSVPPALPLLCAGVAVVFVAALCLGAQDYGPGLLWQALVARDPKDLAQAVVVEMRLPRALAALMIGAALAVSGLMMQALTRNPLADPGLTGVNAGAALAVVAGLWFLGPMGSAATAAFALSGAAAAAVLVRLLAGSGGGTLRLPLAGAAFASLCLSVVSFVVLMNPEARNLYRFWMVGSLALADTGRLAALAPLGLAGICLGLAVSRQVESLMLGEDLGAALGLHPGRVLSLALAAIAMTSGAAVAIAGPVGFIGLIAPHLARRLASGAGLGVTMLLACPLGAGLTLLADIAGRWLMRPAELPLGIVLAMIGAPVFMLLIRSILRKED
ncbi:iron complex transport system permease protein [Gemmobacter caeni]|nr:iron complex transport system permease protein [Gemmobacter caeni]